MTRTPSASGGPEYTLRLDRVPVEHVLGGADCLADLYQLAVAGACSLADGAVSAALALTRDHVATRRQFGRPLAAFQAVAQQVADVYIASRTLHLATMSACWRLDAGLDAAGDLAVAGLLVRGGGTTGRCGPVITCTAGRAWTSPIRCTASRRWSATWCGSSAGPSTNWSGRHVH